MTRTSSRQAWRSSHPPHPVADVFPMLEDEELDALAEDIKENGLRQQVVLWQDDEGRYFLLDGRNRLEAMERAGVELPPHDFFEGDPVAYVISANIRRRHLTKRQQASLIVKAVKAGGKVSGQVGPKRKRNAKGGRPRDPLKAEVVEQAAKHDISERTAKRALAEDRADQPARPRKQASEKPPKGTRGSRATNRSGSKRAKPTSTNGADPRESKAIRDLRKWAKQHEAEAHEALHAVFPKWVAAPQKVKASG